MLYNKQLEIRRETYEKMLQSAGMLSNLFSDSESPYLASRLIENVYCEALNAENLGRSDCSADASLDGVGVGLKTFLHGNGKTLQKVAEFNKDSASYRSLDKKELVEQIAHLRNNRIEFTMRAYDLTEMIYHCVTREKEKVSLFEIPMDLIDIKNIKDIKSKNNNTITFNDGRNEYSFNLTKSTLYKRFYMGNPLTEIDVEILENPFSVLEKLSESMKNVEGSKSSRYGSTINDSTEYVILPLFSDHGGKRIVPERSGINQWNANGRKRDADEIYFSIPKWIHNEFPDFFPPKDKGFKLILPDKTNLDAKVCQDGGKALMSNPNKALGQWMLRKVLLLKENELVTYEYLEGLGIDSVAVYKHSKDCYLIDFCGIGTYDEFHEEHKK